MGKSLVIVESPAKAKTINKYLGNDFIVKSSVGHVRDLPTSGSASKSDPKERARQAALTRKMSPDEKEIYKKKKAQDQLINRMGIDPEHGWKASYEILPGKEKVVEELKRLAKDADQIYLATDLDREGKPSLGTCGKLLARKTSNTVAWYSTKSPKKRFKQRLKNHQS